MSECDVDAIPEPGSEVVVEVEPGGDVDAIPEPGTEHDAEAEPGGDVDAIAEDGGEVDVESEAGTDLTATAEPADEHDAELEMGTLNQLDREKLDSIDYGARNDPLFVVKIWETPFLESTRTVAGSCVPFVGTDEFQEAGAGRLLENQFTDAGWLRLKVVATYTDPDSAGMIAEFTLETSDIPDIAPDADPATRGTFPTFTVHKTWESEPIYGDAEEREFCLILDIESRGHVGAEWFQTYAGGMLWDDIVSTPERAYEQPLCKRLPVSIDPTVSKMIRLQFRVLDTAGDPVDLQTFDVTVSRCTHFQPLEGSVN